MLKQNTNILPTSANEKERKNATGRERGTRGREEGEGRGRVVREGGSGHHIMHAFDFLAADATKERPKEKRKEEERKKSEMK